MRLRIGRQRMVLTALAAAAMLSAASGQEQRPSGALVAVVAPMAPAPAPRTAPAAGLRVELERLQHRDAGTDEPGAGGAFDATTWRVAPPPPPAPSVVKPAPPPPPSAPPLPFAFMGLYEEGGRRVILLTRGDRLYTVSEGEVIDQTYRVERLNGGLLELTYLPLSIRQTLNVGTTG